MHSKPSPLCCICRLELIKTINTIHDHVVTLKKNGTTSTVQ